MSPPRFIAVPLTLEECVAQTRSCAEQFGHDMAVVIQINGDTGEHEYGFCPASQAAPALVREVLQIIRPSAATLARKAARNR